ncbi:signal peptidase I [Actinoplanes sp. NPDC051861]|uniref:signal peptidase I n=1 Tax=Actinoplanes sp. NPDC051861 TaxID=3155170 RepID=UPI0034325C1F
MAQTCPVAAEREGVKRLVAFALATYLLLCGAGWSSSVVVSGSMSPAVEAGDVVITSPVTGEVRAGQVVRFRAPGQPGRAILHRVVGFDERGMLITKGDANEVADATPVPLSAVTGVQQLRLPGLGGPALRFLRSRR